MTYRFKTLHSLGLGAVVALGTLGVQTAQAIPDVIMHYASVVGATIDFTGASMVSFVNAPITGNSFLVGSSDLPPGDSVGAVGQITGGALLIGPGAITATLTGTESVKITDTSLNVLTFTVDFKDITQTGAGGQLNLSAVANVTGISYVGAPLTDLAKYAADAGQNMTLSWSFSSPKTLADLRAGGLALGYSGSLQANTHGVPDGGMTACLLGFALVAVEGLRRKLHQ